MLSLGLRGARLAMWWSLGLVVLLACTQAAAAGPRARAAAAGWEPIGPGTTLLRLRWPGAVSVSVLRVDLGQPRVRIGLLFPGALAEVQSVSQMAAYRGAFAAVNGDFFNIGAAGAPIGPVVSNGRLLKGPERGRTLVAGVESDGRGSVGRVWLQGSVTLPSGRRRSLSDLNDANRGPNPILNRNGIGLFTRAWGDYSLAGAVHGMRSVSEVLVRGQRVVWVRHRPSAGPIGPRSSVLLGAGSGGRALAALRPGDRVTITDQQQTTAPVPFRFAIGGKYLLLYHGAIEPSLGTSSHMSRTAIGFADRGRRVYLMVASSPDPDKGGLSLSQEAHFLRRLGVRSAVGLDDGGSTTMAVKLPGQAGLSRLAPVAPQPERLVANGVGVFAQAPNPRHRKA